MKKVSIASKLVAGSDNLNRMREETHRVCRMLVSMLKEEGSDRQDILINNPEVAYVKWIVRQKCTGAWAVLFYSQNVNVYDSDLPADQKMIHGLIEFVYDNLDLLIQGVCDKHPCVQIHVASFVKIADKFQNS